ncbi:hypothetical protein C1645_807925 [Glomus cerebriforme]|uniref:Uncharacterized protein n=1 Tax=Glomus cerebriforme TaxID=658196 RepID=A0A397SIU5_9GLOM|nr:hypothetical protein C1645_807925 [Glomus cerebriforme]
MGQGNHFQKRLWPLVHKYEFSKRQDIKEMHATYSVQFPIFHANFMIMGIWLAMYYTLESIITLKNDLEDGNFKYNRAFIYLTIPLDSIFLIYTILMFKAVRDESKIMVYFIYLGNIIQAGVLYFLTTGYCYQYGLSLSNCFKFDPSYDILLWQACLGWIILGISTWNINRCYKNFGKNVGFYIKYEPTPPEFKPGRKLVRREYNYTSEFNFSDSSTSAV